MLSLFFFTVSMISFSQNPELSSNSSFKKNQIGIQFNPFLDQNAIVKDFVYGIRYGYKISKPITLGLEIAGSYPNRLGNLFPSDLSTTQYKIKVGLYARYTAFTEKRVQCFLEVSPYYLDTSYKVNNNSGIPGFKEKGIKLYVAPGLTLFSKNRKFSVDLYYKITAPTPGYYERNAFSYKVNLHF